MTLEEKLNEIKENHPEVYGALCADVPDLIARPSEASEHDLDHYNFWIDSIDEDEAQHLYHLIN